MNCEDVDELLTASEFGGSTEVSSFDLRAHLELCPQCRGQDRTYRKHAELLALSVDPVDAAPALRRRIMATVHREAAAARGRIDHSPWYRRLGCRITTAQVLSRVAAVGTVAVVAGLYAWSYGPLRTPTKEPSTSRVIGGNCGLTSDPAVTCELTYGTVRQATVLVVRGLPPEPLSIGARPDTLEVWLIRPNGAATPAGFLSRAPGQGASTAALTGSLVGFSMLAATEEPPGGSSTPTGRELVRVSLDPLH